MVCLSNSALVFNADLARLIQVPVRLHTLGFSSYTGTPQTGEVRITLNVGQPLQDRLVLMMEGDHQRPYPALPDESFAAAMSGQFGALRHRHEAQAMAVDLLTFLSSITYSISTSSG